MTYNHVVNRLLKLGIANNEAERICAAEAREFLARDQLNDALRKSTAFT